MSMAFTQPLILALLALLPYFAYLGWPRGRYGRGRAWAALALRGLIVVLIVLSLAGAQFVRGGDELAVVFLVDVSDSVPDAERERALDFVGRALEAMRPGDQAALILFGADALVERLMEAGGPATGSGGGALGPVTSIPDTHQTDLEGAIRLGLALFPAGPARRMVILSDGRPTLGRAEQAVRLAYAQSVRVDVVPLFSSLAGEAWLSELDAPTRLHQGEEFTLSVTAHAIANVEAVLTVLAGGRVVARQQVHLNPGSNTFAVPLVAGDPGFTPLRASLAPATDVYAQNNSLSAFTLVEGPPRVLIVSPLSQEAGAGGYLPAALAAAGLEVEERTPGALGSDPAALASYGSIVLVDTPAQAFSPRALAALQSYVRDLGGGLVAVGGPRAYGVGGWYATPLEEILPVEMTIQAPERFPPMSIVVVIDKSGSMAAQEGGVQKIRLAGEAAARVAELITDLDQITVIAFDDRPADVVGPLPGSQRQEVIDRVIRLQAGGGGIYVREGLKAALGCLADSDHPVRHILLLADGSDAEHQGGVRELVREQFAARDVTLSTVAIGSGADVRFLEEIAALGRGRFHFTDRAVDLPVIFAQETQLAMRTYVVEEPFYPRQASPSPILTGVEAVPQLGGYVATAPKPASRVILVTHQDDPLLAAWQYGLGRAVAWTSDAGAGWARRWVEWDGFPRFWAQVVRWTALEQADLPVEVAVALEGEMARVTVDAMDPAGGFVDGLETSVNVVGPEGETTRVELAQTAPGRYEGTFAPQAEGAYLMRLVGSLGEREVVALTSGWVKGYSPEYAALEGHAGYLARLAELGGGGVLEQPALAFAHTLQGRGIARDLRPYLLGLAALLLPFDVGLRRLTLRWRDLRRAWTWMVARLARRRPPPVAEVPSPVASLIQAKSRAGDRRPGGPVSVSAAPEDRGPVGQVPASAGSSVSRGTTEQGTAETAEDDTLARRLLLRRRKREGNDGPTT